MSDNPVEGLDCKEIQTSEETTSAKEESKKSNKEESDISYSSNKATRVTIIGNRVLVPVTFVYENNETNANLVLDTGASGTTIHENVASQLYINLNNAHKMKGRVVGGGTIDANMITMNSVKVGPYTFYKRNIFVVPYEGPPSNYDGLLGMDLLQEINYKLDLGKQILIWE
ncbi:MAG: clan AA aspartic protease [Syntrophaceae bacterium]|nr:clan AA aspartic protease [Syntrophaceae bacterium]